MDFWDIIFRVLGALLSVTLLGCLGVSAYWLCSETSNSERYRVMPGRAYAVQVVAVTACGVLLYHGLEFLLSFLPGSWGSVDEGGEWQSTRSALALPLSISLCGGLIWLYSCMEQRRHMLLWYRIESSRQSLVASTRLVLPNSYRKVPASAREAKELLDNLQDMSENTTQSDNQLVHRAILEASLSDGARYWRERKGLVADDSVDHSSDSEFDEYLDEFDDEYLDEFESNSGVDDEDGMDSRPRSERDS